MRVVRIARKAWTVGMDWYAPSGGGDLAEVKAFVEAEGSDCITMRGNQIGHGKSNNDPAALKSRSLAAWISVQSNTFIGIFRLADLEGRDFWWVFARSEGHNIGGYGDTVYESREEAFQSRDEIRDLLPQYATLDDVIVCETLEESLAWLEPRCEVDLVARWRGDALISPITEVKSKQAILIRRAVVTAVIVAMLGGLAWVGADILTRMGLSASAREAELQRQALREKYQRNPEILFEQTWHKAGSPSDAFTICLKGMNEMPLNHGGWVLGGVVCRADKGVNLLSSWEYTPMADYGVIPEDARFSGKGNRITGYTLTRKIDASPRVHGGPDFRELLPRDRLPLIFLQLQQGLAVNARTKINKPSTKSVQDIGTFTCPWVSGSFEINSISSVKVAGIGEFLEKIPGLTVKSIAYDMNVWTIKGDIYGK